MNSLQSQLGADYSDDAKAGSEEKEAAGKKAGHKESSEEGTKNKKKKSASQDYGTNGDRR